MSDTENEQAELIRRLDAALVEVTGQRDALLEACEELLEIARRDGRGDPCFRVTDAGCAASCAKAIAAIAKTEEAKP